jgi:hypothetical protein
MTESPEAAATTATRAAAVAAIYEEVLADIARGLHARPMQALSGALLVLELLEPHVPESYHALLGPARASVKESLTWLQSEQPAISPSSLHEVGLAEALSEALADTVTVTADASLDGLRIDPLWSPLVMRVLTVAAGSAPSETGHEPAFALAAQGQQLLASVSVSANEAPPGFTRALALTEALGGDGAVQFRSRWNLLLQIPLRDPASR